MKKIVLFTLGLLLIAGIAYSKDYEVKKKMGEYDVEVKIDKNPPVVGENGITIKIKDSTGKDVTDAKVTVEYSMPPMPGMPPMDYKTDTTLKGNKYRASMNLSMSGAWNIAVKLTRAGKTLKMKFTVDAK